MSWFSGFCVLATASETLVVIFLPSLLFLSQTPSYSTSLMFSFTSPGSANNGSFLVLPSPPPAESQQTHILLTERTNTEPTFLLNSLTALWTGICQHICSKGFSFNRFFFWWKPDQQSALTMACLWRLANCCAKQNWLNGILPVWNKTVFLANCCYKLAKGNWGEEYTIPYIMGLRFVISVYRQWTPFSIG